MNQRVENGGLDLSWLQLRFWAPNFSPETPNPSF